MTEDRSRLIFTSAPPYQLNVSNHTINAAYEHYISVKGIKRPMSDKQRIAWERDLWKYLRKVYRSCTQQELPHYPNDSRVRLTDLVRGGQYERLDHIVNCRINPQKMIERLYNK